MPFDKMGKHHMNTQKMMAADKSPNVHKQSGSGAEGVQDAKPDSEMGDSTRTVITHHDDGTHSVQHHDGEESGPHMDLADAMDAIHAKHGGGMAEERAEMKAGAPAHDCAMSGM